MEKLKLKARSPGITTLHAEYVAQGASFDRFVKRLAENIFWESPVWRMLMRGGIGRKRMRIYRELKGIRRPRRFRQDVW